jgi:hypothetical protein
MPWRQPRQRSPSSKADSVARFDPRYATPKWPTFWLLAAFTLLIGIGVVTVLLPELEDDTADPATVGSDSDAQE